MTNKAHSISSQKTNFDYFIEWAFKGALVAILGVVGCIYKTQFQILSTLEKQQTQIDWLIKNTESKVGWDSLRRIESRLAQEPGDVKLVANAIRIERESR